MTRRFEHIEYALDRTGASDRLVLGKVFAGSETDVVRALACLLLTSDIPPSERRDALGEWFDILSISERETCARVLGGSDVPLLQALARELEAETAIERARFAEITTELVREHIADMNAASADLPAPGTTE
jgi:hypothetical protein